jgi:hypothetical protein
MRAQSFCEGTQKSFERTGTPEFLAFPNAFPRLADENWEAWNTLSGVVSPVPAWCFPQQGLMRVALALFSPG